MYYYGARYYSAWLGRFVSVDPLQHKYPYYTPYQYAGNKPITYIDLDGLEEFKTEDLTYPNTQAVNDATNFCKPTIGEKSLLPTPDNITFMEAAEMADNVYDGKRELSGRWEKFDIEIEGVVFNDEKSGFKSAMYRRVHDDGSYEYAYVTAGTEPGDSADWITDALQALGFNTAQYSQSVNNARLISNEFSNLTFVGHSLGGGLASANALATGRNAITFNAAGLHSNTKKDQMLNKEAKIDAFIVLGEAVDYYQQGQELKAEGKKHYLPAGYVPNVPNQPIHILESVIRGVQRGINHTMGRIIEKMKEQGIK